MAKRRGEAKVQRDQAQAAVVRSRRAPEAVQLARAAGRRNRQLAIMTGDPLIMKIAEEVAKSMDQPLWNRLRDDGIYDPKRIQLYVAEHRLIYEAIICGDGDAAAFYVEGHIKRVRRDIAPR